MSFDVARIRARFPALALTDAGRPRIYLDNPGGTQVPVDVVEAISTYLVHHNANVGGYFRTSIATTELVREAHRAAADLVGAASPAEVVFGPNMTSLTFSVTRALAPLFRPGDELLLTRMDHDANVAPWLLLAEELGLTVRWLDFDPATYRYDLTTLDALLTPRTRLAAVNYASNATGTINDVAAISRHVREAGGLVFVDAVQYVPHGPTDVQALGCDLLTCSAYKFFGPHQGILWGREEVLDRLRAYKVRPAPGTLPGRLETGTQSHEGQAGTLAAIDYLAWIGETMAEPALPGAATRRDRIVAAMESIAAYERILSARLVEGLLAIPGVTVHGITDVRHFGERVPTVSFTMEGHPPDAVARALADENIFVWSGHYYAVESVRRLGLHERGGMVRTGAAHYNTVEEIDRFLACVERIRR